MESRSFAGFSARPSPWGYNWATESVSATDYRTPPPILKSPMPHNCEPPQTQSQPQTPDAQMSATQLANMPAALLTSLKRDKKPFTYTPGGVNLSEVLNARLQKRTERKKKYHEEKMAAADPVDRLPRFDPPRQVIVMPTYNSPLDMYSMENALEALEVQAELVANDRSLSSPTGSATLPRNYRFEEKDLDSDRGVTQSKAFKVLQIITDTEAEKARGRGSPVHHDEMRFTGIRDSKSIPSRFFQTLQKITGTDEDDDDNRTQRQEAGRSAAFARQSSRPVSYPQQQQAPLSPSIKTGHKARPLHKSVTFQEPRSESPSLKRPAAFMPMQGGFDPMSRVKPVQPSFLANGSRRAYNPAGGTDF